MEKLKWFLICALPIGLIAMTGCSPPKSAPVSQAASNPVSPAATAAPVAEVPEPVPPANTATLDVGLTGNPAGSAEPVVPSAPSQPENPATGEPANNNQPAAGEAGAEGGAEPEAKNAPLKLPPFPGPTGKSGTEVGDLIPEIKGKDIDKKSFKLTDYSGRVLMVDFWGDW